MVATPELVVLSKFLVQAKRRTYAAQGDEASVPPALPGSKQLEHTDGDWYYRDIYFGTNPFSGVEVVSWAGRPVWSMTYFGRVESPESDVRAEVNGIYLFLRSALRQVEGTRPFRGPSRFSAGEFTYQNRSVGAVAAFRGTETIQRSDRTVYRLRYAGGLIA
jgi:Domain of unknown function (DUF5680)